MDGRPGLTNSRDIAVFSSGPATTFYGFGVENLEGPQIDYIFLSPGIRVDRFKTLTDHNGVAYPSDHLPVLADISLE